MMRACCFAQNFKDTIFGLMDKQELEIIEENIRLNQELKDQLKKPEIEEMPIMSGAATV
jgi:hypothetical protein